MEKENENIKELNNVEIMKEIYKELKDLNNKYDNLDKKTDAHTVQLKSLDEKYGSLDKKLDNLDKIEKLHFEYTRSKFDRIDKKIDSNFTYLDNKIDNTKDNMVSQITDLFESFSITTSKLITNLEKKIDNEMKERKTDISRVKSLNDYDRIILKELESRISILEEENEKYTAD